jgi:hypothetical protein
MQDYKIYVRASSLTHGLHLRTALGKLRSATLVGYEKTPLTRQEGP